MTKTLSLNVYYDTHEKIKVGELIQQAKEIYFQYDNQFLESGIELSPFKLPLISGPHTDKERVFSGLQGVFNDSLPDGWGLLLMDRHFRKIGIEPFTLSPLERLAFIGDRAMGALIYEPAMPIEVKWQTHITLQSLASNCERILEGYEDDILPELIIAGGSPGGARPKVLIGYNQHTGKICTGTEQLESGFRHYIVKFSTMIDVNDIAEVEYAYAQMANNCGIDITKTRLFDAGKFGKAFGMERFDRFENQRIHMHTLSGLLHADYRMPNLDYLDFLKAIWLLTQSKTQVLEGYKRTVFNVLMHNRDDHSKNFSFLLQAKKWRLAPAYDLTFSSGIAGEHTMTVMGEGANPQRIHLLKLAEKMEISSSTAEKVIQQIHNVRNNWSQYADKAKVKKNMTKQITRIFTHLGSK